MGTRLAAAPLHSPRGASYIAFLLGVVFPGWGHVYVGRTRRFAVAALAYLALALSLAARGALSSYDGMVANLVAAGALWLFSAIDAALLARGLSRRPPRGRWALYLAWWLGVTGLWAGWLQAREPLLGYGVFRMVTDSMTPAINHRDIVLVDTRAYHDRMPGAGDVVVVREPEGGARYVRRVTAIEGRRLLLVSDRPSNAGPRACDVDDVVGRATDVLWSRTPGRAGDPVR